MASRALVLAAKRSLSGRTRSFHASSLQLMGGGGEGMRPPLPPFKRSPPKSAEMVENADAVWDDGVAPELALDFDAPFISTQEAFLTLTAGLSVFFFVYQGIKLYTNGAPENPALPHHTDNVGTQWHDHDVVPLEKKE